MARGSLGLPWMIHTPFGRYLGCEHITGERVPLITGNVSMSSSMTCPRSWVNASRCIASSSTLKRRCLLYTSPSPRD
eukprot:2240172-Alexandrium_andersonii.AAC.1